MATSDTVNAIGGAAGGIAGMFPGIGTGIGAGINLATTLVSGILQNSEANKQKAQAAKVRSDALNTKTGPMRPEYLAKLRMDKMAALSGVPGMLTSKAMQEEQTANSLRSILESSPNGAATVAGISAALQQRNAEENKLAIRNEEFKERAQGRVSSDLEMLGNKGVDLEDKRDQWKREGLQAASAFDNAATANKMNAANTITGAIGSTATAVGKAIDNKGYMNQLAQIYGGGLSGKTDETAAAGALPDSPLIPTAEQDPALTSPITGKSNAELIKYLIDSGLATDDISAKFILRKGGYKI